MARTSSPQPSAQTFWSWMGICFLFVVPAIFCIGDPLTIVMFSPIFGLAVFAAQMILWKVTKNVRHELYRRIFGFIVPVAAASWVLFTLSFFYGRPRSVLGMALQEKPPLLFWATEFEEDSWTDYTVRMRVVMDPAQLRSALEKHFEKSPFQQGNKQLYYWKDVPKNEAMCQIATDDQFSYAEIQYGVD